MRGRRWWNEVGGSHGVSCFVREARPPPLSLCFFARKPRSDIAPDTLLALVLLTSIPIHTQFIYIYIYETGRNALTVCIFSFFEVENSANRFFSKNIGRKYVVG